MISSAATSPPGTVTRRISVEPGGEVGQVAEQEGGGHAGEGRVAEGQRQRVGGEQRHAPLAARGQLALRVAQHRLREVGADHHAAGRGGAHREREVAGAGGQVEGQPGGGAGDRARP